MLRLTSLSKGNQTFFLEFSRSSSFLFVYIFVDFRCIRAGRIKIPHKTDSHWKLSKELDLKGNKLLCRMPCMQNDLL